MGAFPEIILRTVIAFALIMIIARIIGKSTIAQMTFHDFVSSITLGAITSNLAFNTILKPWHLIASLITFSSIAFITAHISLKNRKLRKWLSGKPTILIENGKILEQNLRKLQFSLDTLNQELREKDIFDIVEVEYAILELNGRLSILKKPEYRQVTRKDLSIMSSGPVQFPIEMIMDGEVVVANMNQVGLSQEWLTNQLKQRGLTIDEVCYAVKGTNGSLYCDLYKDNIKHPIAIE